MTNFLLFEEKTVFLPVGNKDQAANAAVPGSILFAKFIFIFVLLQ
jgi:hypothetical protein